MQQQIEAQHTSWGQGCSPTFVVDSLPLRSNSAPLQVTPLPLCTSLTSGPNNLLVHSRFLVHFLRTSSLMTFLWLAYPWQVEAKWWTVKGFHKLVKNIGLMVTPKYTTISWQETRAQYISWSQGCLLSHTPLWHLLPSTRVFIWSL